MEGRRGRQLDGVASSQGVCWSDNQIGLGRARRPPRNKKSVEHCVRQQRARSGRLERLAADRGQAPACVGVCHPPNRGTGAAMGIPHSAHAGGGDGRPGARAAC